MTNYRAHASHPAHPRPMMPFSVIATLLLALLANAQPQAPISWGEVRLLQNAPQYHRPVAVYAHGDTLVLNAARENPSSDPAVCISSDNGQTWGSWQVLGPSGQGYRVPDVEVVFSEGLILGCADTSPLTLMRGFFSSTDLGNSWVAPPCSLNTMHLYCSRQDTLFCNVGRHGVTWTADHGHSFSPVRTMDLGSIGQLSDISTSCQYVHVVSSYPLEQFTRFRLFYFQAPLYDGAFGPGMVLNDNIFRTDEAHVTVSEEGTGMILSSVHYYSPWGRPAIVRNISRDNGLTWSAADTLTPFESQEGGEGEGIQNNGRYWMAYWVDSTRDAGFVDGGVRCQFSANAGRSWYPSQQAEDAGWAIGDVCPVDLQRDCVRVFIACQQLNNVPGQYFLEAVGQIHPDTLPPAVSPVSVPPDTVEIGSQQLFLASITDNDTLYQERLVIRSATDTMAVPIEWTGSDYLAHWTVPHEGRFFYRIEGEDFWENVGSYPDSGWAMLVTPGWVDEADDGAHAVRHYGLSAYPNPFNSSTTLSFDLAVSGRVEMVLYDVTGRRIQTLVDRPFTSGSHTLTVRGEGLGSGIYFVRLHAGRQSATCKVMVLK